MIYDILMQDVPYEKWLLRIINWIKEYGISSNRKSGDYDEDEKNLVVDLGCGTGTLTEMLSNQGYDMIGIDNSASMLSVAAAKRDESESKTLYLCQDMREMELYSTVGTVVCVCDSLNYIVAEDDILKIFKLVNNYLYLGGIFIFDFNTVYKYREIIGDTTIAENHDCCSFIWENYYHFEERINEYEVTFFIREESGCFVKCVENHIQKGFELDMIKRLLAASGLEFVIAIDDESDGAPDDRSERIVVIARKGD
ncbi:MAG: class I SAM-dependent methyltransferase [Lachnospiraceae bacterium]|nr:class I SAM-dependent methyltransferase [Lachnospiraceae bacterium]